MQQTKEIKKVYMMKAALSKKAEMPEPTIQKYSDMGLMDFIDGKRRIYQVKESLKRLKEIKTLKAQGYSLTMIRDKFSKK